MAIEIRVANLDEAPVIEMLDTHWHRARAETAAGSAHALSLAALRASDVTVFAAWQAPTLLAIGALRRLEGEHWEIKSMYTAESARRRGVGGAMLEYLLDRAAAQGARRVSLETGSWPYFAPARALYRRHGFCDCGPFGAYREDPNSVFMTRALS